MTKKILVTSLSLLLLGAGCLGSTGDQAEQVSGDWWVAFDLPAEWVMYAHYPETDPSPELTEIDRELTDVVLQNTTLPIVFEGQEPNENVPEYTDQDYTYIRVLRYDVGLTRIPDEAVELENGFLKRERTDKPVEYWLPGEYGNYRFMVTQDGQDLSAAEEVIFTAEEVTEIETVTEE